MNNKYIFIIILIFILFILIIFPIYENYDNNKDINYYYYKIPNIYYNNVYNYKNDNDDTINTSSSINKINLENYIYSPTNMQKIICNNYNNQADCWASNLCKWEYKNKVCKISSTSLL